MSYLPEPTTFSRVAELVSKHYGLMPGTRIDVIPESEWIDVVEETDFFAFGEENPVASISMDQTGSHVEIMNYTDHSHELEMLKRDLEEAGIRYKLMP
jgi:hypothetical protein